jgi:hypothetical protein
MGEPGATATSFRVTGVEGEEDGLLYMNVARRTTEDPKMKVAVMG